MGLCYRENVVTRLATKLVRMKLSNAGLSVHAFRRTCITLELANKIPVEAIRAHGTWGSDAEWQY